MKKNKTLKTAAGLVSLMLAVSTVSCSFSRSSSTSDKSQSENEETTESSSALSYQAEELGNPVELNNIKKLQRLGGTDRVLITATLEESGSKLFLTDLDLSSFTEIKLDTGASTNSTCYSCAGVSPDGSILAAAVITDYGDFIIPDFDDPDFDSESFDYDAMLDAAKTSFKLIKLDSNGKQLSCTDIKGLDKYSDDDDKNNYATISGIYPCDDDVSIVSISNDAGTFYSLMNSKGELTRELELGYALDLNSLCTNNKGEFAFTSFSDDTSIIKTLDPDTFQVSLKDIPIELDHTDYVNELYAGEGEYDYFILCSNDLVGVRSDGTVDTLINWFDTDLNGESIYSALPVGNSEFIVAECSNSVTGSKFYKLSPCAPSEEENADASKST